LIYENYEEKHIDVPLFIAYIHPQTEGFMYLPLITDIKKTFYDQFITEKIYSVIFRKNFIDPTEFTAYMSCYEEVFETTSDQNTNLNVRVKENDRINNLLSGIWSFVEKSYERIDEFTNNLLPIKNNCDSFLKIDFNELKEVGKADEFKSYLESFLNESKEIKKLKEKNFVGLFEYFLQNFIENIKDLPDQWINKTREIVPEVLLKKLREFIVVLNQYIKVS